MQLREYLDPGLTLTGLQPVDKQSLLKELARHVARGVPDVDEDELHWRLTERESQSSTGVGEGVAIPHCFLEGLKQSVCLLAQVPAGIDFGAIDGKPVKLLFVLLSPPDARMVHLRLLARISRIAMREGFITDATSAATPEALHALIVQEDLSHAG